MFQRMLLSAQEAVIQISQARRHLLQARYNCTDTFRKIGMPFSCVKVKLGSVGWVLMSAAAS